MNSTRVQREQITFVCKVWIIKTRGVPITDWPTIGWPIKSVQNNKPILVNAFSLISRVVTPTTLHQKVKFLLSTVHELYSA